MLEIKNGLRLRLGKENVTVVDGKLVLDNPQQSLLVNALRSTGQEALYADVIRIKYDLNCVPLPFEDQELLLGELTEEEAEILGVMEAWTTLQAEMRELELAFAASDAKHAKDDETRLRDEPEDEPETITEEVLPEVAEEPTPEAEPIAEPVAEEVAETPAAKPATKKKNAKIDDLPQE